MTHTAIAFPGKGEKLVEIKIETPELKAGHVLIRVSFASTTPLDIWQGILGFYVDSWPLVPSDSLVGEVIAVHHDVSHLKVGDHVFSFTFTPNEGRAAQEIAHVPANRVGKIPKNISEIEAVTVPNNLVTAIHSLTTDLKLSLKLLPNDPSVDPSLLDKRILIWGSGTSVGQYAIQVLKLSGYKNIITTASSRHHDKLRELGATVVVDYNSKNLEKEIGDKVDLALDCVGDVEESLKKIGKVIKTNAENIVAAMLPLRLGGKEVNKVTFEVPKGALPDGTSYSGVRTHFYEKNELYKDKLQPEIVPELLASGKIKPNKTCLINDQPTRLENYQKAIDRLKCGDVSGEKLVVAIGNQ